MRVLVFESSYRGHVFTLLRHLLPALSQISNEVICVLHEQAPATDEFRQQLAHLSHSITFEASLPTATRATFNASLITAQLLATVTRLQPDYIYIPRADGLAQILGLRRATGRQTLPTHIPTEGLMLRGSFAYPQPSLASRAKAFASFYAASLSRWSVLHYLDPIVYDAIKRRGGAFADHCRLLPEWVEPSPIRDRLPARQFLQIPEDGRYIGFGGGANRSKGAHLLLQAFAAAQLAPTDRLLFAGPIDPDIRALIDSQFSSLVRQDRLILLNRYLPDDQLFASMAAMDVVCTPYVRHVGSASFVIRAAAAERFVLASNYGWMGTIVPQFSLGSTCNVENIPEFSAHIVSALGQSATYHRSDPAARFVRFHTIENFQAAWTLEIRRRIGNKSPMPFLPWEWVVTGRMPPV